MVYIHLPIVRLPQGCIPGEAEGLLRVTVGADGYQTRLFLSVPVSNRGKNWKVAQILDRQWHVFSYNNVPPDIPPVEILLNHLGGLRDSA